MDAAGIGGVLSSLIGFIAHPIGSYYWSSEATDPATLFGGTWAQIKDRFIYAQGSKKVGTTGGEESHTLTIQETPNHQHGVPAYDSNGNDMSGFTNWSTNANTATKGWSATIRTNAIGSNKSHNNMPPYLVAYCWRRVG